MERIVAYYGKCGIITPSNISWRLFSWLTWISGAERLGVIMMLTLPPHTATTFDVESVEPLYEMSQLCTSR
jgi:hypothetical protein